MKRLIIKVLVFLLPVIVVILIPLTIAYKSGELYTISVAVKEQNKTGGLYGTAYANSHTLYKIINTRNKQPKILALGTSRIMQIRDFFFKDSFYNAGAGVFSLTDFQCFFNEVYSDSSVQKPSLLIISLDQYFFNEDWASAFEDDYNMVDVDILSLSRIQLLTGDILSGKVSLSNIKNIFAKEQENIGLTAITYGEGFRPDGSYFYSRIESDNSIKESSFQDVFNRIESSTYRFEKGEVAYDKMVKVMADFLEYCSNNNIHVIAFMPPYPHTIWEKMIETNNYEYIITLQKRLEPIFAQYNYNIFDYSDMSWIGSSDEEAIDGLHGSEKTYLRMLIEMSSDSVLNSYIDKSNLEYLLQNTTGNYYVKNN